MMMVIIITMMMIIMMNMLMIMLTMTSWDAEFHRGKLNYLNFTDRNTARCTVYRRKHGLILTSLDVG